MQIRVGNFDQIVSVGEFIVQRSRVTPACSVRTHYASAFFAKAVAHGRSICILLSQIQAHQNCDVAGICALARSVIETHNVFLYLTEPGIGRDELQFRVKLVELNQASDLIRISKALGWESDEIRFWQDVSKDRAVAVLTGNAVFGSLEQKQQTHLLRGKTPYVKSRFGGSGPVKPELESAVYNLFSHNVHAYGLSTSYAGSSTPAGLLNTLFLAVEVSAIYLANLLLRFKAVRSKAVPTPCKEDMQLISETLSLVHLSAWQDGVRNGVG